MAPTASPPTATERIQRHIESIFPAAAAIPEAFRLPAPVHQREYLIRRLCAIANHTFFPRTLFYSCFGLGHSNVSFLLS